MRSRTLRLLVAGAIAVSGNALAQSLTCPPSSAAAGRACETFHYHVQSYRPDSRTLVELSGVNQFSSQPACERARELHSKRNLAVVDYFKRVKNEQNYEPDRFGNCHCDTTVDKVATNYLTDAQRTLQLRLAEEIRLRVRERLLDSGLTSDAEVIRGLMLPPQVTPLIGGPRLVQIPPSTAVATVRSSTAELKATKAIDTAKPTVATVDLPLVDVVAPGMPAPTELATTTTAPSVTDAVVPMTTETVAADPPPTPAAGTNGNAAAEPTAEEMASAQEVAESFISYETERIQNIIKASTAIADEDVKSKIFEACLQRGNLLSNLRTMIEGSGMRSRLAKAARAARLEDDRLAFVAKLFGSELTRHWAPQDAADVILEPRPDIDADPERVLRDTTGKFNDQQKKRALYVLLAKTQPTEDQQLWLGSMADSFLR